MNLSDNARQAPGAKSLHEMGCYYLAVRDFDEAIKRLKEAVAFDGRSARIHCDLGTAYFEKGKIRDPHDSRREPDEFSLALVEYNLALELAPHRLEVLFNRGLLSMKTSSYSKASSDWLEYIKMDPGSPWAEEARENLRQIGDQK